MNMTMLNYENALCGVADFLRDKVADYLDINRHHVVITKLTVEPVWENADGEVYECARLFAYKNDVGDEVWMDWYHKEDADGFRDLIMTPEDFEAGFDNGGEEN